MALLDKVRKTLSNIGQRIDQNPTKTGVQLLPPVNIKQNVRNLLNTQVSVPKPVARLTTNLANITPGRIASQGLLQNKPLQSFAQAGLRATPLIQQPQRLLTEGILSKPVREAVPAATKGFAQSASFGLYRAPEPTTRSERIGSTVGQMAGFTIPFKGATALIGGGVKNIGRLGRVGRTLVDLAAGSTAVAASRPGSLKERAEAFKSDVTNPLSVGFSAAFPFAAAAGLSKAAFSKETKNALLNEPGIMSIVGRFRNLDSLDLTGQIQQKDFLKKQAGEILQEVSPDAYKQLSKIQKKDPELWLSQVVSTLEDKLVTAKDPILNMGMQAQPRRRLGIDTLEFSGKYDRGDVSKLQNKLDELLGTNQYVMSNKWKAKEGARQTAKQALESAADQGDEMAKNYLNEVNRLEEDIIKAQIVKDTPKLSVEPTGEVTKPVEMPQLNKQLESIQPAPKALGDPGISTKPQPEPQKAQTLRNLKQESVPLDNIISEAKKQIGTTPEPKDKNVKQVMDDLYTQWVSRYNPIEEASIRAKKTLKTKGAELRPEFDPEYLVRRLTGAGGIADQRFKTELNPIIKEMESLNIPKSDMDVYLANKRIAGFGKAGRDIYGADPKKAQEVVAAIESKYGNIQGIAQKMYDYQNKGFQEMVDAGFISPEAAQTIKSQNPDYAPLYRVMDEMDEYLGLPTRKTMQGTQPISKLKGSTRQIESPVESIIGNTFKQRAAIEKNRVAQSIVGLQNIADMGFTKASKASPETITVWNNGKKEYWNVGKDIAETAKGQNEEQMNLLLKVLQAPASLLRQGATGRNPEFLLPNIIRDQLDAGITSKYGYIPFVDFTSGLISMAKNDDVYKKWANSGAKIDLGEISGKKSIQELFNSKVEKKKLSTWLSQGLDVLGTLSEQPTRVGLFKKAYKKTGNELIAMMESRDATVDFARMGSKMKVANSIIPFLNVGVQGFDKLIRAVKNNPGRVALNAGIYGALPAIMTTLYNLNKDPEAYAEIPQYEKDSNFILVIGRNKNGTVDYLTFPKGNVIPTIANPIESFLAFTRNEDPEAFKQMLTQTLTSTLPVVGDGATAGEVATKTIGGLIPQGIKPLAENLLNKSFYKYDPKKEQSKEIVPYYMQNKPAYQQTYDFTPQMYQKIGAVFNASPLKVKNLMEGYLAGYTKIPSQIVEMMYKTSRGEEISPNEKTLMRRFIKQTYPNSGKEPEVKPEVPGLMERVTGKVGAAETAPVKEIKYKRASDNSSQTIKLSDLQKPTGTTLKDYLSSGNRESTIREIYKGYATGAIKEADMQSAFKTAGVTVKEAEDMVIKELPLAQKSSLVYDRLVSPTSTTKDLDSMVESKLLTTNVITELTDSGKITEEQSKALKNYLKQKSGKVSKGKKPKKFKPTKFKPIKLKGAKKTYLKQKKLTLKDLLRK